MIMRIDLDGYDWPCAVSGTVAARTKSRGRSRYIRNSFSDFMRNGASSCLRRGLHRGLRSTRYPSTLIRRRLHGQISSRPNRGARRQAQDESWPRCPPVVMSGCWLGHLDRRVVLSHRRLGDILGRWMGCEKRLNLRHGTTSTFRIPVLISLHHKVLA